MNSELFALIYSYPILAGSEIRLKPSGSIHYCEAVDYDY
ncbi:hypothetical protein yinte0001_7380 [Yersinia intermedia ATCC 29909]|nr:hypothetical protein yinte0001_7380 [Yersinia intermedia ATCC 29909]